MNSFFSKKLNTVLSIVLVALSVIITMQALFLESTVTAGDSTADTAVMSNINPKFSAALSTNGIVLTTDAPTEPVETTSPTKSEEKSTTAPQTTSTVATTTQEATVQFATAIPPDEPADYNEQWAAGYIVAIDNPDKTYECSKVELTDEDRDLLERLCFGEFGTGGFIGAALIAQAVKDAMCFDGYPTVESVIENCHYDGRTDRGTTEECKQAVSYIFDENHDAVQHRIMYMYNPELVQSSFHESQNYILTYEEVRFFDRWGY
jgi:hypothetical protein